MNAQQLKNSILQEAIEGRLVPQDPNDEPASVLLERIRKEKARLVKEGKLKKKELEENPVKEDEEPFSLPKTWKWIRFGNLVSTSTGKTPARGEADFWGTNDYPWVSISDMKQGEFVNSTKEYVSKKAANDCFHNEISKKGTLIMSFKLTVGRTSILGIDAYHNEAIISIRTYADNDNYIRDYLAYILPVIANSGDSKDAIKGKTLNSTSIYNLLVPLPPLAEQKRIVEKIEELLPKVKEYGKAQESLDKLNEELPERLKKSILQEAIEGRLVPQDPNDEPASVLLDKIRAEKKRLVKEGKLKKKDLEETSISENEIPFNIPEHWEWLRLSNISRTITKGTTPRGGKVAYSSSGIGFLRAENIAGFGELDLSSMKYVTEMEHNGFLSRSILEANDILITIAGTLGRTALVKESDLPLNANQAVSLVRLVNVNFLSLWYIIYALNSPSIQKKFTNQKKVTAIPNLTLEIIGDCLIPLPPLAEQKRIVEKIEQIFKEIDKLKV